MARTPDKPLAEMTRDEIALRLRRLQGRMQILWDGWQTYERLCPEAAVVDQKRFEKLEAAERVLLDLLRNPKEGDDGEEESNCSDGD